MGACWWICVEVDFRQSFGVKYERVDDL